MNTLALLLTFDVSMCQQSLFRADLEADCAWRTADLGRLRTVAPHLDEPVLTRWLDTTPLPPRMPEADVPLRRWNDRRCFVAVPSAELLANEVALDADATLTRFAEERRAELASRCPGPLWTAERPNPAGAAVRPASSAGWRRLDDVGFRELARAEVLDRSRAGTSRWSTGYAWVELGADRCDALAKADRRSCELFLLLRSGDWAGARAVLKKAVVMDKDTDSLLLDVLAGLEGTFTRESVGPLLQVQPVAPVPLLQELWTRFSKNDWRRAQQAFALSPGHALRSFVARKQGLATPTARTPGRGERAQNPFF